MASEPPEGISTVVSARRVRIDGTVTVWAVPGTEIVSAFAVERSDTSVITLRLMRPSLSTTGVKLRLTPNFLKSIDGWQVDTLRPLVGGGAAKAVEDGKFAAGDESRGLAGNRRQIGLGERMDDTGLFHGLQASRSPTSVRR